MTWSRPCQPPVTSRPTTASVRIMSEYWRSYQRCFCNCCDVCIADDTPSRKALLRKRSLASQRC
ncbi:hypothetical protein BC834DRAFT_867653 [Gloeopeniophorella convolvens]|nr:hypothetical protein BC834DRAFT_867653 [Gloeopeniophorella convolvens]